MMISHPPDLIQRLYPSLLWKVKTKKPNIYLTFDDGPTPGVTDQVLDKLKNYKAKATFFCLGNNIRKHPELFKRIVDEGHKVGNHSYNHLNGWKSTTSDFLQDVRKFEEIHQTGLFRPPYGRIRRSQINALKKEYKIVMWSILSRDYDPLITPAKCQEITLKDLKPGSIIVFHDSVKAKRNMLPTLEKVLVAATERGLSCKKLKSTSK